MQKCLMIGCGQRPVVRKFAAPSSAPESDTVWETLDIVERIKPTYLFDLERLERGEDLPGSGYDEIHAYEVLEHFGRQGDYRGYFNTFRAFWKALKPGGYLIGTCPDADSIWAWGDPGHTRVITQQTLSYLVESHYRVNAEKMTPNTDYVRFVEPYWWEIVHCETFDVGTKHLLFALERK